jgi:DNA-directed RNA polymerase specialized sigma24 family protein
LRHFIINWRAREDHRQSWEILWLDRAKGEDEDEEDANMDDLLGNAPDPETLVLLRAELDALRDEVSRLTPLNQRIFALLFDEGLSEKEVSLQLRMKASTVRWHVYAIRQHLEKWRQAREE